MEIKTINESLDFIDKYTNQQKRTYIKVCDRSNISFEIYKTGYTVYSQVVIYSKTWSKRFIRIYNNGSLVNTRSAKCILNKLSKWVNHVN